MNNAARGVVFAVSLLGMAFILFGTLESMPDEDQFRAYDLAGVIFGGFLILSCAVFGAAALASMKPAEPKTVTFPQQQGAVPPQGLPYPQQAPPQYAPPPQRYGHHPRPE
ncbi:hypothetical protein [Actinomadura sp. NEAU-AAG7]|uniref:hypothetical protein n=1 Tax=Actinomadura sp. NEAU-AAG7 TaxID=2839640 RepID=UPI001BE47AAB|nr:hypothetical protein [Actinomadura sp. NEAU-AAG7]MBT2213611.1 hypothetical protein [Actinomadura sp. NEAU-AAG7]